MLENNILNLKDGPQSVAFNITSKCNFRCLHCYNNSGCNIYPDMTDEELISIAQQIANFKPINVCLCGGEPLLKGVVYKLIQILRKNSGNVSMVSNGYLINEDVGIKLKESGLGLIQFSLDGINNIQHDNFRQKNDSYNKVINAIQIMKDLNIDVVVAFSPNKININSFQKYINMCKSLKVNEIRIMPLIPMGRGSNISELLLTSDQYITLQQTILNNKSKGISIEWGDPIDHLYRMPNNAKMNASTYGMDIRSDGKLMVSGYLPLVVGDCLKHKLKELWDEGYDKIWSNNQVLKYTKLIKNIYDFQHFVPEPYTGEDINIDLIT